MPDAPFQSPAAQSRVSVILTVYQRTAFLRQAIESALNQTLPPEEIIVTDDSAKREIREICESYAGTSVRYRCNASPLGVTCNLRAAAGDATGDFIAILNDDDAWEPGFLEALVPPLGENPGRVLAFGDHWIMQADGTIDHAMTTETTACYGRDRLPQGEVADTARLVLEQNGVPLAMAAVFRKDAVDWTRLVPEVQGAYDYWISCLLASTGRPFYYVNRRLSRYRLHDQMETARHAADKNENMVYIYRTLIEENRFPAWNAFLRRKLAGSLRACGRDCLRFGNAAGARTRFLESLQTGLNVRAVAGWLLSWIDPSH